MDFRHDRIDPDPPSGRLSFCLTSDLTGNGRPDVIVGGAGDPTYVSAFGKRVPLRWQPGIGKLVHRFETNLFWYENPGWKRHKLADAAELSVGAALGDITGNGRVDLVTGRNLNYRDLYWFEQPADPRDPWRRSIISEAFEKHHDLAIGDVDNDGEPEVVGLSQESEAIFYYDIPAEPRRSPWPRTCRHIIAEGIDVEGIRIVDIDGDGENELIAGPNVFYRTDDSESSWEREVIVKGWEFTRVAVGDLDDDGDLEVVLTEGDRPLYGGEAGRVGWFDPPDWTPHVLRDDLYCPHSVQTADFEGNGTTDIYVGEMGLENDAEPRQVLFHNRGGGAFEQELIASGIPTHEAKAVDLTGSGYPDIIGKSYAPTHHVDAWYNQL